VGRAGASVNASVKSSVIAGHATAPSSAYAYRAARADGAIELGVLDAESREGAAIALSARGLFPIDITLERETTGGRRRLPARDLALGLRVLATLLESGLPMTRALSALEALVPDSWQMALPAITRDVREGRSLASAMAAAPVEFPPVVLGIVQAGESGSGIALAVRRAADLTEQAAATRAAIIAAMAYPCVLAGAGTASIALLVGVVLPRFGAILTDLGQPLPWTTRFVLGVSVVARAAAIPMLILGVVAAVLFRAWRATPAGARRWHELLLGVPFLGEVRRSTATARASAALAALLESGVPVSTALVHGARASGDAALSARILMARESVVVGQGIARALGAAHAMTPTAVRLVQAGEETGRLAHMLAHAATLEREQAERKLHAAVRLLEPGMILVFGGIVAIVAAALLQAIYSVRPAG
jgi:general secretion pathway protein F